MMPVVPKLRFFWNIFLQEVPSTDLNRAVAPMFIVCPPPSQKPCLLCSCCSERNITEISPDVTVRRRDHPVLVYQRAPTEVLTLCRLNRHNVLDWMWNRSVSSHDTTLCTILTCDTPPHTHTCREIRMRQLIISLLLITGGETGIFTVTCCQEEQGVLRVSSLLRCS